MGGRMVYMENVKSNVIHTTGSTKGKMFLKQWQLQLFVGIGLIWLAVFSWCPLFGLQIAFKDYKIKSGFIGMFTSQWNNFKFFKEFFGNYRFSELLRNTLQTIQYAYQNTMQN